MREVQRQKGERDLPAVHRVVPALCISGIPHAVEQIVETDRERGVAPVGRIVRDGIQAQHQLARERAQSSFGDLHCSFTHGLGIVHVGNGHHDHGTCAMQFPPLRGTATLLVEQRLVDVRLRQEVAIVHAERAIGACLRGNSSSIDNSPCPACRR